MEVIKESDRRENQNTELPEVAVKKSGSELFCDKLRGKVYIKFRRERVRELIPMQSFCTFEFD
jgi:hypothetical protein